MQRHPADEYTFENGETLRLLNYDILIKMHSEDKMTTGGLHRPDGALEHVYKTGEVLAFGYVKSLPLPDTTRVKLLPKPIPIPGLEKGNKVCFVRFRDQQDSNKVLRAMFGDDIICLKEGDILFCYTGEIELGQ